MIDGTPAGRSAELSSDWPRQPPQQTLGLASPASAAPASHSAKVARLCSATPQKGFAACLAERRTDIIQPDSLNAAPSGLGPADLTSAYNLPSSGGGGATVAIVDAQDDPNAEADVAAYRSQFGLSECSTDNGCFQKVNQDGDASPLPDPDAGWAVRSAST
ncbi:MAG: hypothetical protein ACR2KJ_13045 [Jatrophihabitans sp.]